MLRISLGVVLLCVSAVAVRALVRELDTSVDLPPRIHPEYEPLAAVPTEAPVVAVAPPPEPARTPRARPRRPTAEPADPAPPAAGTARPAAPVRIAPAPGEEAPIPGEPPGLAVARRRVSITMYSADWCGSCRRAREYLREHHIRYTDRDIDDGERNRERLRALNPEGSIPTFDIEDRVLVGFGPASLEATITAAAYEILGRR